MSSLSRPALVFIPGAWHDASTWDGLRPLFEAVGYDTYALTNVSLGARKPPVQSHMEDADAIRKKVREIVEKDRKNVLLIGHSYAGAPMSESVQGLEQKPGEREFGVIGCVFVCAYMIGAGQSVLVYHNEWQQKSKDRVNPGIGPSASEEMKDYPTYYRMIDPYPFFYSDVTVEEAKPWREKLQPQSALVMFSNMESEAWRSVVCTYIVCTEDMTLPADMQRDLIKEAEKTAKYPIKIREIASSHSPWLKHSSELVSYIREAAGEEI